MKSILRSSCNLVFITSSFPMGDWRLERNIVLSIKSNLLLSISRQAGGHDEVNTMVHTRIASSTMP